MNFKASINNHLENTLYHFGVRGNIIASLLCVIWPKRLLAKIATARQKNGEIIIPLKLLSSLKRKKKLDIKKINKLSFSLLLLKGGLTHNYSTIRLKSLANNKSILLLVHNSLPYDSAGYALRTIQEANAYKALGYKVLIATRLGYPWDLTKHRNLEKTPSQWIGGIEIITLSGTRKYKVDSDLKYAVQYGQKIAEIVKERDIGLIQASSNYINGFAAYIASRKCAVPYIYEARGMWHVTGGSANLKFRQSERFAYEDKMERLVLNHASANIFITDLMKQQYHGNEYLPSVIVRNCIDVSNGREVFCKRELQNKSGFKLLYAGSLVFYEGLEFIIEAVGQLVNQHVSLDIYGEGPYKKKILNKLATSNFRNVTYHGKVSSDAVSGLYTKYDAVVVPRIDCEVTRMVPPLKPVEAIWNGLPVIVSELPALVELLDGINSVVFATAGDVTSLKQKILHLRDNYSYYVGEVTGDIDHVRQSRTWVKEIAKVDDLIGETATKASKMRRHMFKNQ
jgi:glycosyltransferase involved in cell wall biosynthesis